jgi:L-ascorbate metabolism protein UlaG (beta-lactamase superfamily)
MTVVRAGDRLAITWLGHATALIELDGTTLITDPVLRDRIGPLVRIAPAGGVAAPASLDGVLLSHLHADHADLPSLRELAASVSIIAPEEAVEWLSRRGLAHVRGLRQGAAVELGGVRVQAVPAAHDRRRWPLGPAADPLGYLIRGSRSVYFPGDTDLLESMRELRGAVDVALLPVWGWGPRLGPGHLDPERAARAAELIAPGLAIPIHWGTFAPRWPGGRLPDPGAPAREFARLVGRYAPGVEVRVLQPGERVEV